MLFTRCLGTNWPLGHCLSWPPARPKWPTSLGSLGDSRLYQRIGHSNLALTVGATSWVRQVRISWWLILSLTRDLIVWTKHAFSQNRSRAPINRRNSLSEVFSLFACSTRISFTPGLKSGSIEPFCWPRAEWLLQPVRIQQRLDLYTILPDEIENLPF